MSALLAQWSVDIQADELHPILPDGCRDLICVEQPGRAPQWSVSVLMTAPTLSDLRAGQKLTGFRLRPGAVVPDPVVHQLSALEPGDAFALIEEITLHQSTNEALEALAHASNVSKAASGLGVSIRTLQRLVRQETGASPDFWRQLSRARHAARAVINDTPLAEVAFEAGYADQPHMTRALKRWFGLPPSKLKRGNRVAEQLLATGYGA